MKKLAKGEKGYALIAALVVLVVLGLIAGPLLSYMVGGLKAGHVAEVGATQLYAADAGIQDALWRIKNLGLDFLEGYDEYAYFEYDPAYAWEYPIPDGVNGKTVSITIQNVWIPMNVDAPAPDTARATIQGTSENDPQLTITGTVSDPGASKYEVKISWDNTCAGPKNLQVSTIGVWLPSGFEYVMGSSDLEKDSGDYYSTVSVKAHKGGYAVVWTPVSPVTLNGFSSSGSFTFEFEYDGPPDQVPGAAVPWIVTAGDGGFCAWDADVKIYDIVSTASDADAGSQTIVESYSTKTDARQLGSAIAGDYVAIGNSLMLPDPDNGSSSENDWRSVLLKESSASVDTYAGNTVPAGATITAAYLYWSGWMDHYYWYYDGGWKWSDNQDNLTGLRYDKDNLKQMVEGWTDGSGMGAEVNTVSFGSAGNMADTVADKWAVWPKTNDSPACWYYCCVSDVTGIVRPLIQSGVTTFTLGHATTVVDQLRAGFPRLPGAPSGDHASPGYSFNLYDASGQTVVGYTGYPLGTPAHGLPGSSVYEGRYHAAYAGWSLVIIYSTPSTDIKNQLYVYDITDPNFVFKESYPQGASVSNPDFDGDGTDGGRISGFLVPQQVGGEVNAAKITCFVGEGDKGKTGDSFSVTGPSGTGAYLLDGTQGCDWNDVWNSRSVDPQVRPGIDIDYFYVTWASNMLRTGDTWAQVDIPTNGDGFTLCYVILSFRSSITTGDILGYLIRR